MILSLVSILVCISSTIAMELELFDLMLHLRLSELKPPLLEASWWHFSLARLDSPPEEVTLHLLLMPEVGTQALFASVQSFPVALSYFNIPATPGTESNMFWISLREWLALCIVRDGHLKIPFRLHILFSVVGQTANMEYSKYINQSAFNELTKINTNKKVLSHQLKLA